MDECEWNSGRMLMMLIPAKQDSWWNAVVDASHAIVGRMALSPSAMQAHVDLFNYLLRQRIVFLSGYVNDKVGGMLDEQDGP